LTQARFKPLKEAKNGFKNQWLVQCGKETFYLNQKQANFLKKATVSGSRGIVWFEDFAISIPHIVSIERKAVRL